MSSELVKFHIHYDVDDHFIPMSDFLVAANAAQKIIDDLNRQILGGKLRYQLVIIPPEDGTFLKTIGIIATAVTLNSVVYPIVSDYVLGAFEELAQHKPSDYGKNHMRALKDLTTGFLSKEVEELEKCIPHELNLDKAFKGKTDFYLSCQGNDKIKGIGFDSTNRFPIRNNDFSKHISKDRTRNIDSDFIIYDLIVTSPVIENKDYVWDFQDKVTEQKISAYMRDESFKKGVLEGRYPFKNDGSNSDQLKVLVEYKKQEKNGDIVSKETCVETVYSFNDVEIRPIPKDLPKNTKFQQLEETPMDGFWRVQG